jgi:hypothetical protein
MSGSWGVVKRREGSGRRGEGGSTDFDVTFLAFYRAALHSAALGHEHRQLFVNTI